jgi:hypothetical protein
MQPQNSDELNAQRNAIEFYNFLTTQYYLLIETFQEDIIKFTDGSLKDKECVGLPNNEAILKKSVNTIRVPAAAARRIPRINRKFLFIEYCSSQILFGFHQVDIQGVPKIFSTVVHFLTSTCTFCNLIKKMVEQ